MAFHEVRFPDNISRGARGGPERRTQIVELASGDEERNASWANSRRRYDVAYGIRRADDLAAVVAFFEARNGRLHGFRFKDWGDHKSCMPSGTPAPTDQIIGTGDGTVPDGSGGLTGKGYHQGTQVQLEFVPEQTTDFVFSVYSEEFGLVGNLFLLVIYLLLIGRGMMIAANAPNMFSRLLAGAITMIFFTYAFVNMGMVSGILPVVGVPLPFMSYGGTAFITLGLGAGILMSIQRHRKLVQT